ncbi:MAG: hypothetical protein K2N54_07855 [Helicobacter sp.]|nr:hypothetical protein [Helicobacter sp.]
MRASVTSVAINEQQIPNERSRRSIATRLKPLAMTKVKIAADARDDKRQCVKSMLGC